MHLPSVVCRPAMCVSLLMNPRPDDLYSAAGQCRVRAMVYGRAVVSRTEREQDWLMMHRVLAPHSCTTILHHNLAPHV